MEKVLPLIRTVNIGRLINGKIDSLHESMHDQNHERDTETNVDIEQAEIGIDQSQLIINNTDRNQRNLHGQHHSQKQEHKPGCGML